MEDLEIAYQEALDYIYSFIDYSLTRGLRYTPEKFNLDRIRRLLDQIGSPHTQYPVIHIAGTKGKGSTAAMIASALWANGYKTGFYSSPHLQEYTERIQVDGAEIARADFVALIEELKPHVAAVAELTTFEITTALAFLYFARRKVDVAVVEVGLGGRLDATNVVQPLVSVITSISYDHTKILGNTLTEIGREKAGIIKPGRPVVMAPQTEEARAEIERIAVERDAPLTVVGRDIHYLPVSHTLDGQMLRLESPGGRSFNVSIPLLGRHQVDNAATAYAALQVANQQGVLVSDESVQKGFANVNWPGRFEILRLAPPVIIDSAHNRDSAQKLKQTLDDYLPGVPVILVFGASEDKDVEGMFSELFPRVQQVIATQSVHPRAMEPDQIVELAVNMGCPAEAVVPIENALQRAMELADGKSAVVAAGSLFIAAASRYAWQVILGNPLRA
jgi:dihydrofolate synthase / folylpolyglutamate synthase